MTLRMTEADVRAALARSEKNAAYATPQEGSAYYRDNHCIVELAYDNLALREALQEFLLIEDEDCDLDADGYCMAHGELKPCIVAEARALLAEPAADGER